MAKQPVREWTGPNKEFLCIKCMEPVKGWLSNKNWFVFICNECTGVPGFGRYAMPFPGECLGLRNVALLIRPRDYLG